MCEPTSGRPSHLRDAHRDGDAFGDGKGYRYPHAFREHWPSSTYQQHSKAKCSTLPARLEGTRRQRMLERRAAQLAAAAEAMNTLCWSAVGPRFQIWSAGCNAN